MPMGSIQQDKFQAWLKARVPNHPATCPMCGQRKWELGELIDVNGISGIRVPMAQLVCAQCGHLLLFDARKAGLI
jgi:hypothetical protein